MKWLDEKRFRPGYRIRVTTLATVDGFDTDFYFEGSSVKMLKDAEEHAKYVGRIQVERVAEYLRAGKIKIKH